MISYIKKHFVWVHLEVKGHYLVSSLINSPHSFKITFTYLCIYVFIYVYVHTPPHNGDPMATFWQFVLSFHHMILRDQT